MAENERVAIDLTKEGNMSQIIATDVVGTNGVIHVIDTVIMPE